MSEFDTIANVRKYLINEFAMDNEDVDEMVGIFFDCLEAQLAEIQIKTASGDMEGVSSSGHAIKGAASNIGAVNLSLIGKAFEEAGKESNSAKCYELITQLQNAYAALKTSS